MLKLCLSNDNQTTLRMMLKKWECLGRNWDSASIETVVNMTIKSEKAQEMIGLIEDDDTKNLVQNISGWRHVFIHL